MPQQLLWWRSPHTILFYFCLESVFQLRQASRWLTHHLVSVFLLLTVGAVYLALRAAPGSHHEVLVLVEKKVLWSAYWLGLGVLSSVGLGSGLHTFVLYLGPHIAAVTLAAHECGSLNFPEPPYPDQIICPEGDVARESISLLSIMSKVRLEAFMWGAGTALGELPPYFLAKARSLSLAQTGTDVAVHDEESRTERAIRTVIEKAGFFGILACASIPNPLFDLAGITCGHFLVPFWTFFGATLIGKAVIKMLLQKTFVILAFNEQYVIKLISTISSAPVIGEHVGRVVQSALLQQKASLRRSSSDEKAGGWISWSFQTFISMVILSFVCSLIHIMAQNYVRRLQENKKKKVAKAD